MEHTKFQIQEGIILEGIINGESDTLCAAVTKPRAAGESGYCLLYRITSPITVYGQRFESANLRGINSNTRQLEMLDVPPGVALFPYAIVTAGDEVYLPTDQLNYLPRIEDVLKIEGITKLVNY